MRVLLVDDSASAREMLAAVLEDAGHQVTLADSMADGRAKAAADRYDVAVIDRNLGDGDGAQLAGELEGQTVVVVLSGEEPRPVAGAAAVLPKGGAPGALVDALERVVRGAR